MYSSKRGEVFCLLDHLLTAGTVFWWLSLITGGGGHAGPAPVGAVGYGPLGMANHMAQSMNLAPEQVAIGMIIMMVGLIFKLMSRTYRVS